MPDGQPTLDLDQIEHDARSGWKLDSATTRVLVAEFRRLRQELQESQGRLVGHEAGDEVLRDLMDGGSP